MKKLLIVTLLLCTVVSAASLNATVKTLAVTQVWQHKDTNMQCTKCGAGVTHAVHSPGYVHCDMYCAPASVSMFALFMERSVPFTKQDKIQDNRKVMHDEITGNDTLETHGVEMYCGIGMSAPEIQNAFIYGVGVVPFQFGPLGSSK